MNGKRMEMAARACRAPLLRLLRSAQLGLSLSCGPQKGRVSTSSQTYVLAILVEDNPNANCEHFAGVPSAGLPDLASIRAAAFGDNIQRLVFINSCRPYTLKRWGTCSSTGSASL